MINFEDVRIPDSQRIGNPGEGGIIALQSFNKTRPHAAAFALGVAGRALDEAAKYSLERKTFGAPIAHHQASVLGEQRTKTRMLVITLPEDFFGRVGGNLPKFS